MRFSELIDRFGVPTFEVLDVNGVDMLNTLSAFLRVARRKEWQLLEKDLHTADVTEKVADIALVFAKRGAMAYALRAAVTDDSHIGVVASAIDAISRYRTLGKTEKASSAQKFLEDAMQYFGISGNPLDWAINFYETERRQVWKRASNDQARRAVINARGLDARNKHNLYDFALLAEMLDREAAFFEDVGEAEQATYFRNEAAKARKYSAKIGIPAVSILFS